MKILVIFSIVLLILISPFWFLYTRGTTFLQFQTYDEEVVLNGEVEFYRFEVDGARAEEKRFLRSTLVSDEYPCYIYISVEFLVESKVRDVRFDEIMLLDNQNDVFADFLTDQYNFEEARREYDTTHTNYPYDLALSGREIYVDKFAYEISPIECREFSGELSVRGQACTEDNTCQPFGMKGSLEISQESFYNLI